MGQPANDASDDDRILALIRREQLREAVGLCARLHGEALGRFAMSMLGTQADAEEAVQETLLASFEALRTFRGESSVRGFLHGICRNVCAKRLVVRSRREARLVLVVDADHPTDDLAERRQLAHRLRVALDQLRPSERESLLLRFEADLSFAECGLVLGIDEAAARKRAGRALARLRDVFESGGMR